MLFWPLLCNFAQLLFLEKFLNWNHRVPVHRVAMTTFWRTFHHYGKISPGWWVGLHARPPFTLSAIAYKVVVYAPTERADTLSLFLLYPHMYTVIRTQRAALASRRAHSCCNFCVSHSLYSVSFARYPVFTEHKNNYVLMYLLIIWCGT